MRKLLILNWKMNPVSLKGAEVLFERTWTNMRLARTEAEAVVCPPFVWLSDLSERVRGNLKLGAQDIFWENEGAYTGEISSAMLKSLGAEYVIVGHSERRINLGETDEMINKKTKAALQAGLKVILCIGENSATRQKGTSAVKKIIEGQLKRDLEGIAKGYKLKAGQLIVAYEPIWAIGTGKPCGPKDAVEITKFIKQTLDSKFLIHNSRILYGGSVTGKNILDFVKYEEIDGALVGGASLKQNEIRTIIEQISKWMESE